MSDVAMGVMKDFSGENRDMPASDLADAFKLLAQFARPCGSCMHEDVCKLITEDWETCPHFRSSADPKVYGNIYAMFQPIFEWLSLHYPSGEVAFLVDKNSAKMWQEHGPSVYSRELMDAANRATGKEDDNAVHS